MKKNVALFAFLFFLLPIAYSQGYWQQQVNYKIDVALNDADNTLDGYIKMDYFNNSPDTIFYIWMHVWPNAYKNDQTAFSEQMLKNGSTDFYFSKDDERGYINRLNFKVNTIPSRTENHPLYQDIVKLILPTPLPPKANCKIETPFHVKLPYNFSRGGHIGQSYQITQWFPKPAVYDKKGWHPIPYLDQGEFYSEFGNFDVMVTVPKNYVVAATGDLQNEEEIQWLKKRKAFDREDGENKKSKTAFSVEEVPSSNQIKTLHYLQENVHDFAWFADKTFTVKTDTLKLPSGKIIDLYAFYYSEHSNEWETPLAYMKQALLSRSQWVGEYPYNTVSIVDNAAPTTGGMEYPTITLLTSGGSQAGLERVINHEIGHNWFYGILATNERDFPWMDEGVNTYYDKRYAAIYYNQKDGNLRMPKQKWLKNRLPEYPQAMALQTQINAKKDQPINTLSENFSSLNYGLVAYEKAGEWVQYLENELGKTMFDKCMNAYYSRWAFKHPYPEDFKSVFEEISGKNLNQTFALLNTKGNLPKPTLKKKLKSAFLFNMKESEKYNYIGLAPLAGYNFYDKIMIGGVIHNYSLQPTKFQFVAAPLFATATKKINFIGRADYNWYPGNNGAKATISFAASTFTRDSYIDSTGKTNYLSFSKLVPSFRYTFANKNPLSSVKKYLQWKTYFINEQQLLFTRDTVNQVDIITYPHETRYLNQLQFSIEDKRALYPYSAIFQIEQGAGFFRTTVTGNYYFNFAKGGGVNMRLFAGKFSYIGDKTYFKQAITDAYHLNLTGPKGSEDYTYSNYFVGRNEFEQFSSQQIMIRDGGFKVRTDLLSSKIGKTDNWLAAANFTIDIPKKINPLEVLPIKIPLKVFLDIGTFAEAWGTNAGTGRFLYDAGLQLSLIRNTLNIYFPLVYSKVYGDYFKSYIPQNTFVHNIVFSIDIQNLTLKKINPKIPF